MTLVSSVVEKLARFTLEIMRSGDKAEGQAKRTVAEEAMAAVGVPPPLPSQCYMISIVDIFQEYNTMRRMESVMKSL